MWLVICAPGDHPALWAARGLRTRGLDPLLRVTPDELVCARRLELGLGDGGRPWARAELHGGHRLASAMVRGCLNRCTAAASPVLARAGAADRAYFQAEWDAVLLAWLGALGARGVPLINAPAPWALGGASHGPLAWAQRAQRAGLPTPPARCGRNGPEPLRPAPGEPITQHLVLGDAVFPPLPPATRAALVRLRAGPGHGPAGVTLGHGPGRPPRLCAADPMPDLRVGGEPFLDALAAALSAAAPQPELA